MKSLVEIDHEADFASDDRTNGVERGNVVGEAAEMQLQSPEPGPSRNSVASLATSSGTIVRRRCQDPLPLHFGASAGNRRLRDTETQLFEVRQRVSPGDMVS